MIVIQKNRKYKMYAEPPEKQQQQDQQQFIIQQQIHLYSSPLPEISRNQSSIFYKEIYKQEEQSTSNSHNTIVTIQLGYFVGSLTPDMYDFSCVLINDIHCYSQENIKIIIQDGQVWVTSNIVYTMGLLNDPGYTIIQSNLCQALRKSRQILREMLAECRQRFNNGETDEQILKDMKKQFKKIDRVFKDPNSDY